jgi:hypothetical protein
MPATASAARSLLNTRLLSPAVSRAAALTSSWRAITTTDPSSCTGERSRSSRYSG